MTLERKMGVGFVAALIARLLFTGLGLVILVFLFLRPYLEGEAAKNWPTVEGTVISSESVSSRTRDSRSGRSGQTMYKDIVVYRYTVEGTEYEGDRIGVFTDWFEGRGSGHGKTYAVGSTPVVHYHPQNPERAMLETGLGPDRFVPFFLLIFGGGLSLIGLASIAWSFAKVLRR